MPGPSPDPRRWQALAVTLVAGFMTLLDVSIVAVALPSLREDLGATPADVQWVVSGYALTFGIALVTAGRLGDAWGRRRMFLVALAAFVVCSAAVGAAPTIALVIAARLAQGLAAGTLAPQNSGLIQQLFRGAERGRAFGWFGGTVGVSTAVGPVIGGLILAAGGGDESAWRWIFYVNVPIGVLAIVLAARLLPRGGERAAREAGADTHLDVVGAVLLGAGVLAVMLPLVQAEAGGLRRLWWTILAGATLFAAFAWWEAREARRGRSPLLDPGLVRATPGYASGALLGAVYFVGFSGVWIVFAIFFQDGLGWSPLMSGLAVTPFALGSAVSAVVAGRLVSRLGRLVTVIGLAAVAVGFAATAVVLLTAPDDRAVWWVAPALLVAGAGGGCVVSPNITLTLRNVPVRMAGAAGGALQTGQRMGAALGTALLPGLYYLAVGSASPQRSVAVALSGAVAGIAVALVVAIVEWRVGRHRATAPRELHEHALAD